MEKSPDAFRTISEVAEALDVPPHVLRFWESRFTQVKPVKRGGGRRYYRPDDINLLRGIRGLLYDDGMTIKGVQKILRERGIRHVIGLGAVANGAADAPADAVPEAAVTNPPAKKPRKTKPASPEPTRAATPQPDLFAVTPARSPATPPTAAAQNGGRPAGRDKAALQALVADLQALREVMAAEPGA